MTICKIYNFALTSVKVSIVKFLFPESHSETTVALLPIIFANYFCEICFCFRVSDIFIAKVFCFQYASFPSRQCLTIGQQGNLVVVLVQL